MHVYIYICIYISIYVIPPSAACFLSPYTSSPRPLSSNRPKFDQYRIKPHSIRAAMLSGVKQIAPKQIAQ